MSKEVEYKGKITKIPDNLKYLDEYLYKRLLDLVNHDNQLQICIDEVFKIKDSIEEIQKILKADGIIIKTENDMSINDNFNIINLLSYYPYDDKEEKIQEYMNN